MADYDPKWKLIMIPKTQVIEEKKKRKEATVAKRKATLAAKKTTPSGMAVTRILLSHLAFHFFA